MLKAPYEHIHTKGANRYYILNIHDLPYAFLANESIEKIDQETHRFLRKPKVESQELIQSLKLMPINSHILFLIKRFLDLPLREKIDKGGLEYHEIYEIWQDVDILDLQHEFSTMITNAGGTKKWSFPKTIKNNVARAFSTKGHMFFGLEHDSMFRNHYWLLRTTKNGILKITNVIEVGLNNDDRITSVVDSYLIDKDLAKALISYYELNTPALVDDKIIEKKVEEPTTEKAEETNI